MTQYMGIGLLALPFSIYASGWLGLATLVGSCAFAWYTAFLLHWSLEHSSKTTPNYGDLLESSIGKRGRTMARVLLAVNLFGIICGLLSVIWK